MYLYTSGKIEAPLDRGTNLHALFNTNHRVRPLSEVTRLLLLESRVFGNSDVGVAGNTVLGEQPDVSRVSMADMATLIRAIFSVLVALAAFVVSFLVIFVPMLFLDMHYAPHDGQGGMSGFFIGIPVATIAS